MMIRPELTMNTLVQRSSFLNVLQTAVGIVTLRLLIKLNGGIEYFRVL
jgi:hypothetical protein